MKTLNERIAKMGTKRSAWGRGVLAYALELTENLKGKEKALDDSLEKMLLNGASDWSQYSYGGCALIYDEEIAKRLCTDGEFVRTRHGHRAPNKAENWLDVQARALAQAARLVAAAMSAEA